MIYFYAGDDIFLCKRWDILMQEMWYFYAGNEIFYCMRWYIFLEETRYFYAEDEILYARDEIFPSRIWYMFMQEMKYFNAGYEIFYARDEKTSFGHARRGGRLQIVMPNIVCVRLHIKEGQISCRLNRMLWKLYNTLGAVILASGKGHTLWKIIAEFLEIKRSVRRGDEALWEEKPRDFFSTISQFFVKFSNKIQQAENLCPHGQEACVLTARLWGTSRFENTQTSLDTLFDMIENTELHLRQFRAMV